MGRWFSNFRYSSTREPEIIPARGSLDPKFVDDNWIRGGCYEIACCQQCMFAREGPLKVHMSKYPSEWPWPHSFWKQVNSVTGQVTDTELLRDETSSGPIFTLNSEFLNFHPLSCVVVALRLLARASGGTPNAFDFRRKSFLH